MKPRSCTHVCPPVVDRTTADKRKRTDLDDSDAVLIDVDAFARLVGTTPDSLRKGVQRGHFPPPKKIRGLGLRWRRSAVLEWIRSQFEAA